MRLSGGRIEGFRTAMTGELFAVLRQHSVLRHSASGGWDDTAFDSAASTAAKAPESALTSLFGVRAASLLTGQGPEESTARLSGTLIGAEVGALRALWQGAPVTLLGNDRLSALYARTLRSLGAEPQIADASATTLRGLARAYHQLETQP
jgi:2-dehydro-3-deoxygalactonokinase